MSEPEERVDDRAGCIVACVDVHFASLALGLPDDEPASILLGFLLPRIEHAIRSDDRICPFSVSRLAVQFGSLADEVLPQVLGDRLAQAIVHQAAGDAVPPGMTVSVGVATPFEGGDGRDITRLALAAARSGTHRFDPASTAADHVDGSAVTVDRPVDTHGPHRGTRGHQTIHRRSRYRTEARREHRASSTHSSWASSQRMVEGSRADHRLDLTVLVIDPTATGSGNPRIAARSAASAVEDLCCRVAVVAISPDDPLVLSIQGTEVDLVVLTLDGGGAGRAPTWALGAWGISSRLTASYQTSGILVLSVNVGAGAGVTAACVAQGAVAVADLDDLPEAIRSMHRLPPDEVRALSEIGFTAQFLALVGLTASERRVLFHLTEGRTAQEIADELVVSLTTVRSHIGSVLRKLGVNSQLAAVAIANSRELQRYETCGVS